MTTGHTPAPAAQPSPEDQRRRAFCAGDGPAVFHSIARFHEIGRPDPFDVEDIHAEARRRFRRLLDRAAPRPPVNPYGGIFLVRGASGSGKTHLVRAFRTLVHGTGLGYCGYLPMTSSFSNYGRYVLSKLIDALDQPYFEPEITTSGLMQLSYMLADSLPDAARERVAGLRGEDIPLPDLNRLVHEVADDLLADLRFRRVDLDVLRALLFLQRDEARIKHRVLKYLRGEDLSAYDRSLVDLTPRVQEEDALRLIGAIGDVMWATQAMALVLCVDQVEEIGDVAAFGPIFRRAIATVHAIVDRLPSAAVVVACLDDFYLANREQLPRSMLDRLDYDPPSIVLNSQRTAAEVQALVGRRLKFLYESRGVPFDPATPTFPIPPEELNRRTSTRIRDVLGFCHHFQQECIVAGRGPPPDGRVEPPAGDTPPGTTDPRLVDLGQRWNDFLAAFDARVPDDETGRAELIAWAVNACSDEVAPGHRFAARPAGRLVPVDVAGSAGESKLLVGVCEKSARGGGLGKQVREVQEQAAGATSVLVRSTEYPNDPKRDIVQLLARLGDAGGRRVVVRDTEWRTILALRAFRARTDLPTGLENWLRDEQPLSRLPAIRLILGLDLPPAAPAVPAPPPVSPDTTRPETAGGGRGAATAPPSAPAPGAEPHNLRNPSPADSGPLRLGASRDLARAPVALDPQALTRHAAFLGGTGSGKTTLALHAVEQLLLRGVPAVLVDRKGDLCGYADPHFWQRPAADPDAAARRDRLRAAVDVTVYTPGHPAGRPLAIAPVPGGLDQSPPHERELLARYAADALGGMMGYKDRGQEASRLAILHQAISLLGGQPGGGPVTVPRLIEVIDGQEPALVAAVGVLDVRLFRKLAQDLQTVWLSRKPLLAADADRLDAAALFGLGPHARPGRVRLGVVSTKFLGGASNVEFWVTQFLLELARWASKNPSPALQAVVLFDEADAYLPAVGKPATKAPMENLLKRARSAGLGVLLATQSPGDFDYRCRDNVKSWFVGRVTQQTAIDKMKPLLSEARADVAGKLPGQGTGEFFLLGEGAQPVPLRADRSLLATEQLPEEEILRLARSR